MLEITIDYKITNIYNHLLATTVLKLPRPLDKHWKLKSMHSYPRNNDQLLLQHPPFGTNSYGLLNIEFVLCRLKTYPQTMGLIIPMFWVSRMRFFAD